MTKTLYTTKDVKEVRTALLQEQNGLDTLTGLPLAPSDAVLDHDHSTQLVRGAIHRQANVVLGKCENLYTRSLGWWYSGTLQEFLRKCADYLDREPSQDYIHPSFLKRVKTDFRKLNAQQQSKVLTALGSTQGSNSAERLKLFSARILDRSLGYDIIRNAILASTKKE